MMNKVLKRSLLYSISVLTFLLLASLLIFLLNTSYEFKTLLGIQPNDSHIGEKFPHFNLQNHNGNWTSLNDQQDAEYILIDFWFSACKPCLEEMKTFPRMLYEHGSKLKIISISIDSFEHMEYIVNSKPKPWNILENDREDWIFISAPADESNKLIKTMNIQEYPTYFILDSTRTIISRPISASIGIDQLDSFLPSSKAISYAWRKYSTEDKIKFYRALFIFFNILLIIGFAITYSLKWVTSKIAIR